MRRALGRSVKRDFQRARATVLVRNPASLNESWRDAAPPRLNNRETPRKLLEAGARAEMSPLSPAWCAAVATTNLRRSPLSGSSMRSI